MMEDYKNKPDYTPLSVGAYFGYLLLFALPVVGLIFAIIKAFTGDNVNLQNLAKAELIFCIIGIVLWMFLIALGVSAWNL